MSRFDPRRDLNFRRALPGSGQRPGGLRFGCKSTMAPTGADRLGGYVKGRDDLVDGIDGQGRKGQSTGGLLVNR